MFQIVRGSATTSRILRRGLSEEIGSWKTSWILVRSRRSSFGSKEVNSVPSRRMLPEVGGLTMAMARPVVDLPHPDSPTSPRVSPAATSRLTSETACTR